MFNRIEDEKLDFERLKETTGTSEFNKELVKSVQNLKNNYLDRKGIKEKNKYVGVVPIYVNHNLVYNKNSLKDSKKFFSDVKKNSSM